MRLLRKFDLFESSLPISHRGHFPIMTKIVPNEVVDYYRNLLKPIYADRKLMHVGEIDVGVVHSARVLEDLGAAQPLLLAGNQGTSSTPLPEDVRLHLLGTGGENMVESARNLFTAVSNLSTDISTDIDDWDPDREAQWVCESLLLEMGDIAGRSKYGRRLEAWTDLENKTTIDDLWDSIGVNRSGSAVVSVSDPNLSTIEARLDQGLGTVWVPDNRDGVQGGSMALRWVRNEEDYEQTLLEMRTIADQIRIMPFLEGIPISIHGIVFPSDVAVFRPVELIVLRRVHDSRFLWSGCSTGYDPLPHDREYMRTIARRTAMHLKETVNYRGPYSIDGILTREGFLPTELNPRLSGGFAALLDGIPELPFAPLCWAAMENEPLDYRPAYLEQAIVETADSTRRLRAHTQTTIDVKERTTVELTRTGDEYSETNEGETPNATLTVGPSPVGGIIIFTLFNKSESAGVLVAPEMVRALRFADKRFGTGFGELACAEEER